MYRDYHEIKDQFRLRAEAFDKSARWVRDEGLLDIHQRLAKAYNGNLVLDACCGTGIVGERLSYNGSMVVGLDISLSMLHKAKRKLSFCVNAEVEQFPFLDNIFDIVVCRQAFHFLDTKQVIKEMFRVTKPDGGRIIISQIVPFGEEDSAWLYQIHRKKQPLLKNFLYENDLKYMLKDSGYANIASYECCIEESINDWLNDPCIPQATADEIKKMFLNAPSKYKALHHTKIINGEIFDTMRWVIVKGIKI